MVLVRFNIQMEKDLKRKFKKHALEKDVSMTELIINFIEEVVSDGNSNR